MIRLVLKIAVALILLAFFYVLLTLPPVPQHVTYGVSFSELYAKELGLNWRDVYRATLDDLGVRDLRIPAYWPLVEPKQDSYDWTDLDFMLDQAHQYDAHVILGIGKRLPRWPECHVPEWAKELSWTAQKEALRAYIRAVVARYKDNSAIQYWQVENEPYFAQFGECGALDEAFLQEEVDLVHSLDSRPVLLTDSGNLGTWYRPFKNGDAFGTSLYIYFWNPELGQFKTKLPALVYRLKERVMEILYGKKQAFLIELSLEPWLIQPIAKTPLPMQLERMDIEKFNEIIVYARATSFDQQYLWGVEWWYYMKQQGHPEFWEAAKKLY